MIISHQFPCRYITSCFLSMPFIFSKLCFSSLCSLLISLSTSLCRLSQASLALLYSILSFSLCLLVASCACSSSARSRRHSWSRFFKQTDGSRWEQAIRLIHTNRNTASSLTRLTRRFSFLLTCNSSALGTTSNISVLPSSPWESSSRVTRSSRGFGAQNVKLELREHTSPFALMYTNSYSWQLGLGR